jgi:hypothetical protein
MQEYRVEVDWFGAEYWYNKDYKLHRGNDQPAVTYSNGDQCWYQNGKLHREDDKPAAVYRDGTKRWYKNGEIHRESGPAVIYADGREEYWLNEVRQPNPKEEVKELTVADIEELLGHRVKIIKSEK